MTSPKRRRDESRSPASKDAKKLKVESDTNGGVGDMAIVAGGEGESGVTNGTDVDGVVNGVDTNGVTNGVDTNGAVNNHNASVSTTAPISASVTPPPRSTTSVSPTKKNGPLAEVQNVFGASAELSAVGREKSVWILTNTEALFGEVSDEEWKMYADKVAGALAMLRREWLELEDKRRQLTGGRKRRKA